jgi:hypothetical protein
MDAAPGAAEGGNRMSVYIKGMEMPTSPVLFCVHPDGKVFADLEGEWREYRAVPVHPHGRLIDADALKKNAYPFPCAIGTEWAVTLRQINEAPTIIPAYTAEEEEKG